MRKSTHPTVMSRTSVRGSPFSLLHGQVTIIFVVLLLLLFSSFSTIRAGLHCRASCWVENRFPVYNAWFFGDYCAM